MTDHWRNHGTPEELAEGLEGMADINSKHGLNAGHTILQAAAACLRDLNWRLGIEEGADSAFDSLWNEMAKLVDASGDHHPWDTLGKIQEKLEQQPTAPQAQRRRVFKTASGHHRVLKREGPQAQQETPAARTAIPGRPEYWPFPDEPPQAQQSVEVTDDMIDAYCYGAQVDEEERENGDDYIREGLRRALSAAPQNSLHETALREIAQHLENPQPDIKAIRAACWGALMKPGKIKPEDLERAAETARKADSDK